MDFMRTIKEAYGKRLLVGGHRGHKCEVRENTISNFETLPIEKIPYIEIDVQLTKDGKAVIYHDHDLSMKTRLTGMIRDYSLEELGHHLKSVPSMKPWNGAGITVSVLPLS